MSILVAISIVLLGVAIVWKTRATSFGIAVSSLGWIYLLANILPH